MDKEYKHIDVNNFSESEFLNWLYLERDREESILKTHGWNTWVLIGAMLSVLMFLYTKCRNNEAFVQYRYIVVLTSLFISCIVSGGWVRYFWQRERGYDVKKLRTLFEQSPMLNNVYMLVVSVLYYSLSTLMGLDEILEWSWLACVGLYLYAIFNVLFKKERIVFASTISSNFIILRHQQIFESVVTFVSTIILSRSVYFLKDFPFLFNEFEISIAVVLAGAILYKLLKLNPMHFYFNIHDRSFDQIIDDILYNNDSIENAFNEIKIKRLGFSPMHYIKSDLERMRSLQDEVKNMSENIRRVKLLIPHNHHITEANYNLVLAQIQQALNLQILFLKQILILRRKLTI